MSEEGSNGDQESKSPEEVGVVNGEGEGVKIPPEPEEEIFEVDMPSTETVEEGGMARPTSLAENPIAGEHAAKDELAASLNENGERQEPTPAEPAVSNPTPQNELSDKGVEPGSVRVIDKVRGCIPCLFHILFGGWVIAVLSNRFRNFSDPSWIHGDMLQANAHYWRYAIPGTFPSGELLTDYSFVMHAPPLWWALMASLSSIWDPIIAGKILNVVAVLGTAVAIYFATRARSNHYVGLAAMALLLRSSNFHRSVAGGFARSFGPGLVLLFLACWLSGKRRWTLAVLVLQGALYPSVVIPCGLAYGFWTLFAGPNEGRLKRIYELTIAGVLVILLGLSYETNTPEWWGSTVTLEEATAMPAWGPGGRVRELPLQPFGRRLNQSVRIAVIKTGKVWLPELSKWNRQNDHIIPLTILFLGLLFMLGKRRKIPWEILLLAAASVVGFMAARMLAFKLYMPYRIPTRTLPYLAWCFFGIVCYQASDVICQGRKALATPIALFLILGSFLLLYGDGVKQNRGYQRMDRTQPVYEFLKTVPPESIIAGNFGIIDTVPLYSARQAYMTRSLAHPFRQGYYAECERRITEMYHALYATDLQEVVDFGVKEKVDYLVFSKHFFARPERRMFAPLTVPLKKRYLENRKKGFALHRVPKDALVFSKGKMRVVAIKKLEAALKKKRGRR